MDPPKGSDVYGGKRDAGAGAWDEFPTESAVLGGDDGVSYGLDPKAFSEWWRESIKAAGNAIVPQVAMQIFKAIEQYEVFD